MTDEPRHDAGGRRAGGRPAGRARGPPPTARLDAGARRRRAREPQEAAADEAAAEPAEPEPAAEPEPDYKDKWLRAEAELENVRKRARRDVATAEARGIAKLARELLPALDNLERALAAAEASPRTATTT